MRDLRAYLDRFGHIKVMVEIGGHSEAEPRATGANATPYMVAEFLRDLADDIEAIDEPGEWREP